MEGHLFRKEKERFMTKLRIWASENKVTLYGNVQENATGGYKQNGATRKGTKLYLVDRDGIHSWGGIKNGWKKVV